MYHPLVNIHKWELYKRKPLIEEQRLFHKYYEKRPIIKQITL